MKRVAQLPVKGKKVLLRCDFNVSLTKRGCVDGDIRIRQATPTINYLLKKGAKVILISHFKEPKEKRSIREARKRKLKEGSIYPVKKRLSFLLKKRVKFVDDCIGEKVEREIEKMKDGDVVLLENLRMYKEEKENSLFFAKKLAVLADLYVNDAFSVSHRKHASIAQIPLLLPSAGGMLMQKEIKVLEKIKRNPRKPVVAVVGGAKVESKITAVKYFLENADHVLLGGKIANTMLAVRGIAFNLPSPGEEMVRAVREMDYTSPRLHLPVDVITSLDDTGKKGVRETAPGSVRKEEDIFDIGKETIKLYGDIIKEAGTVIWAGPLGFAEKKAFEKGTKDVGKSIVKNDKALKVVGGGDTNKTLMELGLLEKMDLISYGGGAMLTYLRRGPMPGIKALEK